MSTRDSAPELAAKDAQEPPALPNIMVRRAVPTDVARLSTFYRERFADRPRLQDMDLWEWEFLRNPLVAGRIPFFVLEVNGVIEGAIGYVLANIRLNNQIIPAAHPVNFFVNPQFRGIPALRLIKAVLAECPAHFAGYFSTDTLRLFSRLGFVDLSRHVICHYLPLSSRLSPTGQAIPALRAIFRGAIWFALDAITALWSRLMGHRFALHESLPSVAIEAVSAIACDAIQLEKTHEYVQWRYNQSPGLHCRYLVHYLHDRPIAFAVIHVETATGNTVVLDMQPARSTLIQTIALIVNLVHHCESTNSKLVVTHLLNKKLSWAFRLCAFGTTKSDIGFLVRCEHDTLRSRLTRPGAWHFSIGDTDRY